MLRPKALESDEPYGPWSCRASDIWATMVAARSGDVPALRRLLQGDPNLHRAEYWYTQPIHFAVREGHVDAVRLLLENGADPAWKGLHDDLPTVARDRGHPEVLRLLSDWPSPPVAEDPDGAAGAEEPIHLAADTGDVARLDALLDEDPLRLHTADERARTPLHRAVAAGQHAAVTRLLERGADPNWPEGADAPRGASLWVASRAGDRRLVDALLSHGADPNAGIDSGGSATFIAASPRLRARLIDAGGRLDPYDLVFLNADDEALERVRADPDSAQSGCGGVVAAACTLGKHELVARLLDLGVRVPPLVTECRSYLWCDPSSLRLLLDSGMDPDVPDWQHATPLHDLGSRDGRGRPRPHAVECARLLLDRGATLEARDEESRTTPLGQAARYGTIDLVELLLERGAAVQPAGVEGWAMPLAWATRRGHGDVVALLRAAGA